MYLSRFSCLVHLALLDSLRAFGDQLQRLTGLKYLSSLSLVLHFAQALEVVMHKTHVKVSPIIET